MDMSFVYMCVGVCTCVYMWFMSEEQVFPWYQSHCLWALRAWDLQFKQSLTQSLSSLVLCLPEPSIFYWWPGKLLMFVYALKPWSLQISYWDRPSFLFLQKFHPLHLILFSIPKHWVLIHSDWFSFWIMSLAVLFACSDTCSFGHLG